MALRSRIAAGGRQVARGTRAGLVAALGCTLGIVPHLPGSNPAAAARHLKLPEIRGI